MSLALRPWVAWTTCCPGPKDKSKGGSSLLRFAHGYKYPCHPGTDITCTQNGPCCYSTTNKQTPYNRGPAVAPYGGQNSMPRPSMGGVFYSDRMRRRQRSGNFRPPSSVLRLPSSVFRPPSSVFRLPSSVLRPPWDTGHPHACTRCKALFSPLGAELRIIHQGLRC